MNLTRYFCAAVIGALLVSPFMACPAVAQDKKVLLVLWKGETNAEKAFKEKLAGLGQNVVFETINAEEDRTKLAMAIRPLTDDINARKFSAIYTYGTVGTQVAKTVITNDTPIVFNIVFDPVQAGLMKTMQEPGGSITGVTNGVTIPAQFDKFKTVAPIKNLVIVFDPRAIQQAAGGTEKLRQNVKTVAVSAERNGEAATRLNSGIDVLQGHFSGLRSQVNHFVGRFAAA
ncbi:MAG: ABC transporter substrate binding protein [Azospirillaceae bacterium]|nr:ABC transporter substrate binding protein [Azospirillaceae bacterium]